MAGFPSFSGDPSYKVLQCSPPYCVFRNKQRYQYRLEDSHGRLPGQYHLDQLAKTQTQLCLESLSSSHIPAYLLYGSIRRDAETRNHDEAANHIQHVHHDSIQLFAHIGGRHMDEVFLRDTQHCFDGRGLDCPPGFVLPLSRGAAIREMVTAGTLHWGTVSNLLLRTSAEIYHVRTLGLSEWMPSLKDDSDAPPASYLTSPVILESVQKWQLPEELCSLSGSSASQWGTAAILGASGCVYTWTLADGVTRHNGKSSVFTRTDATDSYHKDFSRRIETSLHPQMLYLSSGSTVYTLDLRTSILATPLYHLQGKDTGRVLSMKQHGSQPHLLMVSAKDTVQLVDTRFAKSPLAHQFVPGGHEQMSFVDSPFAESSAGIFLGSGNGAQQLYMHTLENPSQPVYGTDGRSQSAVSGGVSAALLAGAHPAGTQGCWRWDIDGFPLVDTDQNGAQCSSHVTGFSISALNAQSTGQDGADDEGGDDETGGAAEAREARNDAHRQHRALLIHQTSRGDAFVQRLSWARNPYVPASQRRPTASAVVTTALAAATPNPHQTGARKAKRKRKPAYLRSGYSDDEDEDSDSGASGHGATHQSRASQATTGGESSTPVGGRPVTAGGYQSNVPPPPVQLCLPCGMRMGTRALPGEDATAEASSAAWRGIKRYLHTTLRNSGLLLLNVLSSQCDASNIDATCDKATTFPSGSRMFPPFVPEDSLRGFDLIRLNPSDLHAGSNKQRGKEMVSGQKPDDEQCLESALERLESGAWTLWELWRHVVTVCGGNATGLTMAELRKLLLSDRAVVETVLPTQETRQGKEINAESEERDEDSDATYASGQSDVESYDGQVPRRRDGNRSPALAKGAGTNKPGLVGMRTFDGLYVQLTPADGCPLEYFRDQSRGCEVRMGRLLPLVAASTEVAVKKGRSAGEGEALQGRGRGCKCDRGGVSGDSVQLCDSPHCLTAFRLVYRLSSSCRGGESSTGAGKPAQKVAVEPFHLGGRPISADTTATAGAMMSPEAVKARTQSSQPQALSQQSISLSQLMFGTQASAPTPQPTQASQAPPTAMTTAKTPGTNKKKALPTASEEDAAGMDITDNMIAVLNNNWNRAAGNTPYSDPAVASLLSMWR